MKWKTEFAVAVVRRPAGVGGLSCALRADRLRRLLPPPCVAWSSQQLRCSRMVVSEPPLQCRLSGPMKSEAKSERASEEEEEEEKTDRLDCVCRQHKFSSSSKLKERATQQRQRQQQHTAKFSFQLLIKNFHLRLNLSIEFAFERRHSSWPVV